MRLRALLGRIAGAMLRPKLVCRFADEDELARFAEQSRERRDQVWARLQPPPGDPADDARARNPALDRRVDELELSVATANCLQHAAIETIADLCRSSESELLKLRGLGRKHLQEIKQILADLGLSLGMREV
jgi:DNA-directed RNA polymerase alpha subunit